MSDLKMETEQMDPNEKGVPLFFRDPNEKANQKKLGTDEKIYRHVRDDKLYKRGSIIRAGHKESSMSEHVAKAHYLPHWVEFIKEPTVTREDMETKAIDMGDKPLFYRDPNEKNNQKKLGTDEKIYRCVMDDKLYKHGSILRAGHKESSISDEIAKAHYLPHWIEFVNPESGSEGGEGGEEDETPVFFRDPEEAANQKKLGTSEQIYRFVEDDKLYRRGSILRAGYTESDMSESAAKKSYLPNWVQFVQAPEGEKVEEDEEKEKPLFFRDPNEEKNQKLLKTTENIYRYVVDDKLYKLSSILKAGLDKAFISDEIAKDHYLPQWLEFQSKK